MYNKEVQKRYDRSKKGKERHDTEKYKLYHKKYTEVYAPAYRKKRKLAILQHYGNECACCEEKEIRFLCIDHINGGGGKHIRKIERSGQNFYSWIYKNNFPEGLQVLCYNCNMAKRAKKAIFCPVHHPELYKENKDNINI